MDELRANRIGTAMAAAASALNEFGRVYGDAIEAELARMRAARASRPRVRSLREIAGERRG